MDTNAQLIGIVIAGGVALLNLLILFVLTQQSRNIGKLWDAFNKKNEKDAELKERIIRMDAKLDNYEDLKRKVETHHHNIKEMDKTLLDHRHKISDLRKDVDGMQSFCLESHGGGLRVPRNRKDSDS